MTLGAAGVRVAFGGVVALDGIDVELVPGRVLAVIGPNGSGKSTLLAVLTGLVRPDSGTVRLGQRPLPRVAPGAMARAGVRRTFQDGRLLEGLSALDNVLVGLHGGAGRLGPVRGTGRSERRRRALATLAGVGLRDLWEMRASRLSFGQRRRLELARALVAQPRVLLLDEPTAGLTTDDVDVVTQLVIDAARRGSAVLLVEHDLQVVARTADRVLALEAGRVQAVGPAAEVLAREDVRAHLGLSAT